MTNYSALHHAEVSKRAAEGTDAQAQSIGLEHSAKTYAEQAAASAAGTHFKLFHHDWFDYELNDMAWLRADTFSWQNGTVYTNAYNHLVADYNGGTSQTETVGSYTITYVLAADGHKITTDETNVNNIYNESGVAWYYILDTANQRFKLPRELPITDKAKGNGMTLGLTDGTNLGGLCDLSNATLGRKTNYYGSNIGTTTTGSAVTNSLTIGITTDQTKSGIISHRANENGQQYLYFYVGQFSQSATEQTAGLNSELFNGKVDLNAQNLSTQGKSLISGLGMPSNTYDDLTLGASGTTYEAPANGWFVLRGSTSSNGTITLYTDKGVSCSSGDSQTAFWVNLTIPVKKGDVVTYFIQGGYSTVTVSVFRFIYAKGEENV